MGEKIILFVAGIMVGIAVGQNIPTADAAPPSCEGTPPIYAWNDPCTAIYPPWQSPNWRPIDGIPGTWGPGGYTPCTNQYGC